MNLQKLSVLHAGHEMDGVDYVFMPNGDGSRLLVDCSDCLHNGFVVGEPSGGKSYYANTYCSNAKRIITELNIPVESIPRQNRRPHVPIPEWCPLRQIIITEIPLSIKDINLVRWIISELAGIGRHAAIRPLKGGLHLVIEGELTSDIKEIMLETLL